MRNFLPNPNKYTQSFFQPRNPNKYRGQMPIRCLSAWERKVCEMFDTNPSILYWASEPFGIEYINPIKSLVSKRTIVSKYYPDYLVVYVDKFGKKHSELIEVKPKRQAFREAAKTKKEKLDVVLNEAKWAAARAFAKANGLSFRILTEDQIYSGKR